MISMQFEESLWVVNQFGENLEAILRRPEGKGSNPTVLFVSGFGVDLHEARNSFDEIARHLVENGFATLQFSFAGRGKSEGDYMKMTLERQARQVKDVVAWLRKRDDVSQIGIVAQSFGCPTTMSADLSDVSSICFVSGVYFLSYKRSTLDPFDNEVPVGADFWKSIEEFNPIVSARQMKTPLFMIHGDKDTYHKVKQARQVFDAVVNKVKKIKIVKGGDHGILDVPRPIREEFLQDVIRWFQEMA